MQSSMASQTIRIGLAQVPNAPDFQDRLATIDRVLAEAGAAGVAIVCFPETYLPGLRGMDFDVPPRDQARQAAALEHVRAAAQRNRVAVIMGMEWETELGAHNLAFVVDRDGTVLGHQTKNQIPVEESAHYVPDGQRRVFEIDGVKIGITICHEGWRFPEATRWPAVRGAQIVFHPQLTGSDLQGPTLERWGDPDGPYYEKAMLCRSIETTVYFASVNYAFAFPESASSVIDPEGFLIAHVPYREEALLIQDLDLSRATGFIAKRYDPTSFPRD